LIYSFMIIVICVDIVLNPP